ncbi:MAG: helix-turn-helix domain-containing protein [Cyanobacteria bacterium J06560_5]
MVYAIKDGCHDCDRCQPECLNGAIKPADEREGYWIDPTLCNSCSDVDMPRCVAVCHSRKNLRPLQAKKGRCKSTLLPPAIPSIFINGKTTPFASAMVIWEGCTVLSQRQLLPWQRDSTGMFCYRRAVSHGRGEIRFRLAADPEANTLLPLPAEDASRAIVQFDIRAACVHLIFAAYAVSLKRPWEDAFELNDQHIEKYLGLDKRKDLTKLQKLTLIKNLVYQCCRLLVSLDWPRQGKIPAFTLNEQPIWHLRHTQYYFEKDAQGYPHLIGLSFTLRPGQWTQHFLNRQDHHRQTAYFQYGKLPHALITSVMSSWQQHEGAVRLLLWLLFKLRLGGDHRLTVRTLLRVAYGEARLSEAITVRGAHKRLLKTFEGDLGAIYHHGLKPIFDPNTYPLDIQPLWAKACAIPDDADEALGFWANEANRSITDNAPRDKWKRLLNARLLGFELSENWQQAINRAAINRPSSPSRATTIKPSRPLSGDAIKTARQQNKISQRALAARLGKSQSWIRDVEKERFSINAQDQALLRQALKLNRRD